MSNASYQPKRLTGRPPAQVPDLLDSNLKDIKTSLDELSNSQASTTGVRVIRANASLTSGDSTVVAYGTISATLPSPETVRGKTFTVKNAGTGTVTVFAGAGRSIDGAASVSLSAAASVRAVSDGTNYHVV